MAKLKCPGCNQLINVKRLGFNAGAAAHGITPQNAVCDACDASHPTAAWIRHTPACDLAPDTFFFGGKPKKSKFFGESRMAAANQSGPGTGSGARQAGDARIGLVRRPTTDVSIHVVEDDVTLIGEFTDAGGGSVALILNGSGEDFATYRHNYLHAGYAGLGHSALSVDYRGYGSSSGATTKQGLYTDARAMMAYLRECRGVALNNIVIHGWSIGSVPAVETTLRLAQAGLNVKGLILQCPISSTYDAARTKGSWAVTAAIGARMIGGMHNDTKLAKIEQLHIPILILKGSTDEQGFQDMADKLSRRANNANIETFNGGHGDHSAIFNGTCGAAIGRMLA